MKIFALVMLLLVCAVTAHADVLLQFQDGGAVVWEDVYLKDVRVCSRLYIGEVCFLRSDVSMVRTVPRGTSVTEYGMSVLGDDAAAGRMAESSAVLADMTERDRTRVIIRDREIDESAKKASRQVRKNRLEGRADWAQ